jgi:hypothetical protein
MDSKVQRSAFRGSGFRVITGCQVSGNKEPQNMEHGITNVEGK